jgi:hypothetical protein
MMTMTMVMILIVLMMEIVVVVVVMMMMMMLIITIMFICLYCCFLLYVSFNLLLWRITPTGHPEHTISILNSRKFLVILHSIVIRSYIFLTLDFFFGLERPIV